MIRYERVSGFVFALVSLAQFYRALRGVPVQIGSVQIPVWWSFIAFAVAGALAVWAFRSLKTLR